MSFGNDFDDFSSGGASVPTTLKFEWMIRYFVLGQRGAVNREVLAWCKANGVVLKGHPVQKFSYMKMGYKSGVQTGDPEILGLCEDWGIDTGLPLERQFKQLQAAYQQMKAASAPASPATADPTSTDDSGGN